MEREKWEYRTRLVSDPGNAEQIDILNEFGDLGWELVQVLILQNSSTYRFYFKRRKS